MLVLWGEEGLQFWHHDNAPAPLKDPEWHTAVERQNFVAMHFSVWSTVMSALVQSVLSRGLILCLLICSLVCLTFSISNDKHVGNLANYLCWVLILSAIQERVLSVSWRCLMFLFFSDIPGMGSAIPAKKHQFSSLLLFVSHLIDPFWLKFFLWFECLCHPKCVTFSPFSLIFKAACF